MKIGVIINQKKAGTDTVLAKIAKAVGSDGEVLVYPSCDAIHPTESLAEFFRTIDVLISLGGDGTMLHSVRLMGAADVPIMGINLGTLGFMTSVSPDRVDDAIQMLLKGKYELSERTRLQLKVHPCAGNAGHYYALNDVAVGWGGSPRIISLKMSIDKRYVTTYACDGLVISTPTGSTGHSMSAGGPILQPDTEVLVISPICPHTLSSRPLVVSDRSLIEVALVECSKDLLLAVDGQECCSLQHGTILEISALQNRVKFVHFPGYDYYSVLRQKLRWQGSNTQ